MISFLRSEWLWLLPLMLMFPFFQRWAVQSHLMRQQNLFKKSVWTPRSSWIKAFLAVVGSCSLVIALAGPQWGPRVLSSTTKDGYQYFVALDLSGSMLTRDMGVSRLQFAKRKVKDALALWQGDRVGLIGFAGTAFVQCPLTADFSAVEMFLDFMQPSLMPVPGTSFLAPLQVAREVMREKNFALIILSDGEDHDSDVTATLKEAIDAGLKVVLMGVGTIEGGPLEDEEGKLRKSEDGQMITTTLNEKAMQDLAEKTGARYVRAGVDDDDLRKMMPYLKQSSKAEFSETKDRSREKSFWFALFGLVVLALQFLVGGRQGILGLLLLVGMSVKTAEASPIDLALHKSDWARSEELIKEQLKREPENTTLWYNLGVAQYQQKKYQDSSVSFSKASQGELAKAEALYNLGNAEAQNQNFDGAIAAYEDALRIKPDDQATRENLEYVKKLKDQKNQQQSNQQENNKDDQQSEPKESDPKNSEQKDSRTQDQQQENKDQQKQQPQQDSAKDPDTSDQGSSQAKKDLDRQLTPEEIDKKLKEMSASRTLDMVPEKNRVHKPEAARRAPGGKDW